MTKLNSISISNVRRFSNDVTLNVSSGATIILAPNGTGKTSIFEAIELALTGAVRRLDQPPDALIRDGFSNAKIRLSFDCDQYCEALFNRGQNPLIDIQHSSLFGAVEKDNIPFLLRLTHLLNQNSKDWFVQSTGTAAARQLDSLAIGKDAQYVFGNITSLKRSSTLLLDSVQKDFDIAKEKLQSWQALLDRRSSLTAISETGLLPKQELIKKIQDIDGRTPSKISEQVPSISAFLSEVDLRLQQSLTFLNNKKGLLESLKSTIQSYDQVLASLLQAQQSVKDKDTEIDQASLAIQELEVKVNKEIKLRDEANNDITLLRNALSNLTRFDEASTFLQSLRQNLNSLNEQLKVAIEQQQISEQVFQNFSEKNRIAKSIQAGKSVVEKQKNDLLPLRSIAEDWINSEVLLEQQQLILVDAEQKLRKAEEGLGATDLAAKSASEAKDVLEERLKNLIETSDTIKQAITIIVSNLPATEKNCPVCLTEFEPAALQERMARAVTSINVEITPINEALQKAKEDLERLLIAAKESKSTVESLRSEYTSIQNYILQIFTKTMSYKDKFNSAGDGKSALVEFESRLQIINDSEQAINNELLKLSDIPSDADVASADSNFQTKSASKSQLDATITSVNNQIADQERIVNNLQKEINPIDTKEAIENQIFQFEQKSRTHEENRKALASKLKHESELYETFKGQLIALQTNVQNLDFRKSELLSLWYQSGIEGEPNFTELEKAQEENEEQLKKAHYNLKALEEISPELAKWQAYEEYFKFENEVKAHAGELSEQDFTKKLADELDAVQRKLATVENNNQILIAFSSFLESEIQAINARLEAINPTLGKILKRLTVDPRFADTSISSYQHYKKNYADIKVPLHGSSALVAHVASEAQITDVQFSFLLAMAQTYQWSPWKALLLDDPTQHHDLVHAASVFDLLRDYIVDHGFQVVMATHDSVQAKFFMRKLENDGIPCSLYYLRSTESGVIAETG